jgi:hypothetical protein
MSDDAMREARGARRGVPGARHDAGGAKFDDAIDRAVREMLDLEPPAGLRGRVLDRIDALSPNPVASAFRRNNWWLAAPVAAAAAIVLAVLVPWRQATPRVEPSAAPSIAQVTPAPVPTPPTSRSPEPPRTGSHPASPGAPSGARPSPRALDDRIVVATVAADDNSSAGIDPLAPIDPITVAATRPRDVAPKAIAMSPLAPIAELQIAPLSPPDRRN